MTDLVHPLLTSENEVCQKIWTLNGLTFSCDFDSGNLLRVESIGKAHQYQVWVRPDNAGTIHENHNRTWFYFSVSGAQRGTHVEITIMNLNRQSKLYCNDYRVIYRSLPSNSIWTRIPGFVRGMMVEGQYQIKFRHQMEFDANTVFFAFCYPFSYGELQEKLQLLDSRAELFLRQDIYYHREVLVRSLMGRRVDLITISSCAGMQGAEEIRLDGLFPDTQSTRARQFQNKKVIFITARVHPGETPGSFVMDGVLDFALDPSDPRAKLLRDGYIIKLIPMLNPDGVALGHYRTDTLGANLNRFYDKPEASRHPAIFSTQQLFHHYHTHYGIRLYLDAHAHANKKGCFMYGNHVDNEEQQSEIMSYCKLLSYNTPYFDYSQCNFSSENMMALDRNDEHSKESSGRVALYKQTGVLLCYTLECNYDCGKSVLRIPRLTGGLIKESPLSTPIGIPKFNPEVWADVGKAILITVLDMDGSNPCSRVPNSECGSLEAVKAWVLGKPTGTKPSSLLTSQAARPQRVAKTTIAAVPQHQAHPARPRRSSSVQFTSRVSDPVHRARRPTSASEHAYASPRTSRMSSSASVSTSAATKPVKKRSAQQPAS